MNDSTVIILIISLCILLVLSAFFSAVETAYTSMNKVRMKHLAETKKSARRALRLIENYDKLLSTILVGNNIVNITAASIATVIFTFYFGDIGITVSTVIMTVLVLIFGEISPKGLAKERPEAFAMFASVPVYFFYTIFSPLNYVFNLWKKLLLKVFRLNKKQPTMTEDEFKIIVSDIKEDGIINEVEHDLINNALKYDETLVSSIMTSIDNATLINADTPLRDIKQTFEETNYSRIPVFESNRNNVIGILYRADFYEQLLRGDKLIKPIIKKIIWTEPHVKISTLFARLQKRKQHIAMVGSAGNVLGLITMEDMIEELVGEIEDEYDLETD